MSFSTKLFLPQKLKDVVEDKVNTIVSNISADFSIENISKSPARFNKKKLDWFNQQYIGLLGLDEFITRASFLKARNTKDVLKSDVEFSFRPGSHILFYDQIKQNTVVFSNYLKSSQKLDLQLDEYFLPGGGFEAEKDADTFQTAIREASEELGLMLDPENLHYFLTLNYKFDKPISLENSLWDGKNCDIYLYVLNSDQTDYLDTVISDKGFSFVSIYEFFEKNIYINYWLLKSVLQDKNIEMLDLNSTIIKQFLAYNLDKLRAITLKDFQTESNCILNYSKPSLDIVKWRKNTIEESLESIEFFKNNIVGNRGFWKLSIIDTLLKLSTYPHSKDLIKQVEEILDLNLFNDFYNKLLIDLYKDEFLVSFYNILVEEMTTRAKDMLTGLNYDFGLYLWPTRIVLSGKEKSPSIFELMPILGIQESLERIESYSKNS